MSEDHHECFIIHLSLQEALDDRPLECIRRRWLPTIRCVQIALRCHPLQPKLAFIHCALVAIRRGIRWVCLVHLSRRECRNVVVLLGETVSSTVEDRSYDCISGVNRVVCVACHSLLMLLTQ